MHADLHYLGGKEKNKHESKKLKAGRGAAGKVTVIGAKDRKTKKVKAKVHQGHRQSDATGIRAGFCAHRSDCLHRRPQ